MVLDIQKYWNIQEVQSVIMIILSSVYYIATDLHYGTSEENLLSFTKGILGISNSFPLLWHLFCKNIYFPFRFTCNTPLLFKAIVIFLH